MSARRSSLNFSHLTTSKKKDLEKSPPYQTTYHRLASARHHPRPHDPPTLPPRPVPKMVSAARRGLARGILAPLRPAPIPVRATPALARAGSNIRHQMREAKNRGEKQMTREDASAPSPAAEMADQTDAMRNKFLLPGMPPLPPAQRARAWS